MELTYNLEITIGGVVVYDSLSRAGIATFVPNLDILYSQVTDAIFALNDRKQSEMREERQPKGENGNENQMMCLRGSLNANMAGINHRSFCTMTRS